MPEFRCTLKNLNSKFVKVVDRETRQVVGSKAMAYVRLEVDGVDPELVRALAGQLGRPVLVGIEPEQLSTEDVTASVVATGTARPRRRRGGEEQAAGEA